MPSELTTNVRNDSVALGKAFVVNRRKCSGCAQTSLGEAFRKAAGQLEKLSEENEIFAAHLEILQDPILEDSINEFIASGLDCREAISEASAAICAQFEEIDDEYLRARADDVKDVCRRLGSCLDSDSSNPFEGIQEGDIIVAEELFPSDTAEMDLSKVGGFITAKGSSTSHVCIIARQHSIPVLTGVTGCCEAVSTGDTVCISGPEGKVFINPGEILATQCRERIARQSGRPRISSQIKASGKKVALMANAGNVEDVRRAIAQGAEGIGLFRTEFLFMTTKGLPSEDTQYESYREAARICKDKPLIIRTMDIGGDKPVPGVSIPMQQNPFLGLRGVRFSLDRVDIFKTQLRAILRAGTEGNIKVMFPMVCTLDEFHRCRRLMEECAGELQAQGIPHADILPLGIMVETPSSVLLADEFAREVSFFSIGTNDLTQYIMAADRGEASVAYLYDQKAPAVLRAVRMVTEAAHRHGVEVGICGELASDPTATQSLLDFGIDELSCSVIS